MTDADGGVRIAGLQIPGLRIAALRIVACLLAVCGLLLASPPPRAAAHTAISFRTEDGVTIRGYQFGGGRAVVIFSHMYGTDQRIWFSLAEELARRGYTAITYDYRGIGRSGGRFVIAQTYRDALAAIDYATRARQRPIILVGASMGGTVSLKAAALRQAAGRPVQGVVVMASGTMFRGLDVRPHLSSLRPPKLFIAGSKDQPFADSVRRMHALGPTPKTLHLYPSRAHGTYLFGTRYGPAIRTEIVAFVRRYAR